jgi:hypothetical protein
MKISEYIKDSRSETLNLDKLGEVLDQMAEDIEDIKNHLLVWLFTKREWEKES